MSIYKNFREASKKGDWSNSNHTLTLEEINCGSLQRIADATEMMSTGYNELFIKEKDLRKDTMRRRRTVLIEWQIQCDH
jgi:hypothetical protein